MDRLTPSMPLIRLCVVKLGGKKSAPKISTNIGSLHRYCFSVSTSDASGMAHSEISDAAVAVKEGSPQIACLPVLIRPFDD